MKKTARPIRPNKGIELYYQRQLQGLVKRMTNSVLYWLEAAYKKVEPRIEKEVAVTTDALPSRLLHKTMHKMAMRWRKEFNEDAERIANTFLGRTRNAVESQITQSLRAAGFTVKQKSTRAEQDMMASLLYDNVRDIEGLPTRFFSQVERLVQQAVQNGRDVDFLRDALAEQCDISMRKARTIARDQINKVTEQIAMVKHKALGFDRAIWKHTPVGKTYRHSHCAMNGKEFKLSEGLYDSEVDRNVTPGELFGCHCIYQIILPEIGDDEE